MKKMIISAIFSLVFFSACGLDFLSEDSIGVNDSPNIISIKPKLAFDSSGNAIAVWHLNDGSRHNIWSNTFIKSSGWGTAQPVMENNIGDSINPQLAMNNSGKAVVVWEQKDNIVVNIWANICTIGSSWGDAELIEENNDGNARSSSIAIDSSGKAIAVWSKFNGTRYDMYSNIYSGTAWEGSELIESNDNNNFTPNIEFYSSDNAILVWRQKNEIIDSIYSKTYTSGTGWGTEDKIGLDDADFVYESQIAIDPSGNAIAMAVWGRYENEIWEVYSNILSPGLEWGTAAPISSSVSDGEFDPKIAFDGSGNAIAIWRNIDGHNHTVNSKRYDKDTGWSTQVDIISEESRENDTVRAFAAQIACDSSGNAIAVWHQYDDKILKIYSNRYVPGSGWLGPEVIGETGPDDSIFPYIVFDSSGDAILIWNQNDEVIWAKWFDGTVWSGAEQISLNE